MLAITETAAQAINSLVADNQMPEGSGLRIARQQGHTSRPEELGLFIAPGPAEEDSVLESNGARVFMEPIAVTALEDKELGVERVTSQDGGEQLHFTVDPKS